MNTILEAQHLNVWYGDFHALKNVDLKIQDQKIQNVSRDQSSSRRAL